MYKILYEPERLALSKDDHVIATTHDLGRISVGDEQIPLKIRNKEGNKVYGGNSLCQVAFQSQNFQDGVSICSVTLKNTTDKPVSLRYTFALDFAIDRNARFLVPAVLYKENRPSKSVSSSYPRYDYTGGDPQIEDCSFVSNYWGFRSDRTSLPIVYYFHDDFTAALSTDELFSKGMTGVWFEGSKDRTAIALNFPYTEEPRVNVRYRANDPEYKLFELGVNEEIHLSFQISLANGGLHNYSQTMRKYYFDNLSTNKLKPWFSPEKGAELAAYGLLNEHYDAENSMLYETVAFDRVVNLVAEGKADRKHMHVAWVSGAPYAFFLLQYGYKVNNQDYYKAGVSVIDKICTGISPCGLLWSQYTLEKGWDSGWNPKPNQTQARTSAECVLFLIRAYCYEKEHGIVHDCWLQVIQKCLNFAVAIQREDGNFGSYYNAYDGTCEEWEGCAGMAFIAPLLEYEKIQHNEAYMEAAYRAGSYYEAFLNDEYIFGAPEDVHLGPTSEDAYVALISYMALYEKQHTASALNLAKKAADLIMTFRFAYNVHFDKQTILGIYDYRTRGGDVASPCNNHLHNYGLICVGELFRLFEYTNDKYYLYQALDSIYFCQQFVARENGDFGACKGMMSEQYYYTDWWQGKGSVLGLSHTWCLGFVIHAYLELENQDINQALLDEYNQTVENCCCIN